MSTLRSKSPIGFKSPKLRAKMRAQKRKEKAQAALEARKKVAELKE